MKIINAANLSYRVLNETLRGTDDDCTIEGCCGQRFIAAGMSDKIITVNGIPGNALGAYLNNANITVKSNAQDAVGDTMNEGKILIYGNIQGNAGYRAGIHMKAYKEKSPVMIIGGHAGSFLGEYQAGGTIIVLGLYESSRPIVGNFPCTGMHGGKIYLRGKCDDIHFPAQVTARHAAPEDLDEIREYLSEYCADFGYSMEELLSAPFTVITPDSKNPYKQMYVAN